MMLILKTKLQVMLEEEDELDVILSRLVNKGILFPVRVTHSQIRGGYPN